jgi:hypothetical protein
MLLLCKCSILTASSSHSRQGGLKNHAVGREVMAIRRTKRQHDAFHIPGIGHESLTQDAISVAQ